MRHRTILATATLAVLALAGCTGGTATSNAAGNNTAAGATPAGGGFQLTNRADGPIVAVFVKRHDDGTWSPDLVGAGPIGPGETRSIAFTPSGGACQHDIRVRIGTMEYWLEDKNLCTTTAFTYPESPGR